MIPHHEMNRLVVPTNTICVDGRQWDISNLLMGNTVEPSILTTTTPTSPSTLTTSGRSSSLLLTPSSSHHHREQSCLPSPEMNDDDDDVKVGPTNSRLHDEDEKEYEKEYYYDEDIGLYPKDRPDTPPTMDEIFRRRPLQRRNIADYDISPYNMNNNSSSHSNQSFAILRSSSHGDNSDDDDCSALTFNEDGSVHSQQTPPTSPPVFTPSRPRPMVEVMPHQYLSLRGSDETLFYVEHGFCREARCHYCATNQYFIQDVTMVMCPGCRLIFAPETNNSNTSSSSHNSHNGTTAGSLGLGLRVEEADAIFRQHRTPQRSRTTSRAKTPPPPAAASLQKQYSQTSLVSTAVAAASSSAPNDKGSAAAAASSTARNLLMRRQASLSRFRGSQHSKRSTEGSRAA